MPSIANVHPGRGQPGDNIVITVQYDTQTDIDALHVQRVEFFDAENSLGFSVAAEKENFRLKITAPVPNNAITGPLRVYVAGYPEVSTHQEFTVTRVRAQPLRVRSVSPRGGGARGSSMRITLNELLPANTRVFFPRTDNGPAILRVLNARFQGSSCRVTIPRQSADHGRVMIAVGSHTVLTRTLTFTG